MRLRGVGANRYPEKKNTASEEEVKKKRRNKSVKKFDHTQREARLRGTKNWSHPSGKKSKRRQIDNKFNNKIKTRHKENYREKKTK